MAGCTMGLFQGGRTAPTASKVGGKAGHWRDEAAGGKG
jgi:hypothetical protein